MKFALLAVPVAAAVCAIALAYVLVQRGRDVGLPTPAGPYAVGRLTTTWTDASRQESLGGSPGDHRTLSVWIWYPAGRGGRALPYMPPAWVRAREADRGAGALLFQAAGSIRGHATDASLTPEGGAFPVLVFEPGLGPLIPEYAALAEDLASRGYVVIGLNPTYSSAITILGARVIGASSLGAIPESGDPEQAKRRGDALVEVWAADDRFAIDQAIRMNRDPGSPFAGRLEVQRIGVLGHLLGGAAALEACRLDSRCGAAADLDGWAWGGVVGRRLQRPVLLVSSDTSRDRVTPETLQRDRDLDAILGGAAQSYRVSIAGARHFNFTDSALGFNPLERLTGVLGSIDGARGLVITSQYLAAFFDQTLKDRPSSLLQGPSENYPEAKVTAHGN